METDTQKEKNIIPASIVVAGLIIGGAVLYDGQEQMLSSRSVKGVTQTSTENIIPSKGVVLPVVWGDMGRKLVESGVIDEARFRALYAQRGELTGENEQLLSGTSEDKLKITKENAGFLLNLFWALGLASQNPVLDEGEMMNPQYGGAANFASTGGWTLSVGHPMNHYSQHEFFDLAPDEQSMVERVASGIYRPCCNNSTHFPDCNHGMAMLGLLQLMASQGASEDEMYNVALVVNSYWFPDTYINISKYLAHNGIKWETVSPKDVLGKEFSSSSGYARVVSELNRDRSNTGGGGACGV